jgi:hypothetical protein
MYNGKLKQSKAVSALGFIGGIIFIGIGFIIVIPTFGAFGIFWTLFAVAITCYHGYGVLSKRGVSLYDVEVSRAPQNRKSLSERLEEIEQAKRAGHISEVEYNALRTKALSE